MKKTIVSPRSVWDSSRYKFSQAILAEGEKTLFISGQVAINKEGLIVGIGDVEAQIRQAFENLSNILSDVGASFQNVMKITAYLRDINALQVYEKVLSEYVKDSYPASTVVEVSRLALPELLVEIEAIAVL